MKIEVANQVGTLILVAPMIAIAVLFYGVAAMQLVARRLGIKHRRLFK